MAFCILKIPWIMNSNHISLCLLKTKCTMLRKTLNRLRMMKKTMRKQIQQIEKLVFILLLCDNFNDFVSKYCFFFLLKVAGGTGEIMHIDMLFLIFSWNIKIPIFHLIFFFIILLFFLRDNWVTQVLLFIQSIKLSFATPCFSL